MYTLQNVELSSFWVIYFCQCVIYWKPKHLIGVVQTERPNELQINEQVYIREGNNIRARTAAATAAVEGAHIGLASLMCVRHRFRLLIKTGVKGAQGGILIKSLERRVRQRGTRKEDSRVIIWTTARSPCLHAHDF